MSRIVPCALALLVLVACDAGTPPDEGPAMPASNSSAVPVEGRNRLGDETSPYLLQHRHNPVHWWPWGEDAFAAARAQDKPIFLSIGYSTCYWCHVMERESFENAAIAAILNEHFIAIKVDREERPDVDDIYMTATQIMTGGGGWPMSVFLEPEELRPFYAGTYFPPDDRGGRPGFATLLRQIADVWRTQRDAVIAQASELTDRVRVQHAQTPPTAPLGPDAVDRGVAQLMSSFDPRHGGFGSTADRNKFPTPVNLDFLMEAGWDSPSVVRAIRLTLDRMAMGGMYDQVGGGFHRYSTDRRWLVPHFEKMLYDNGQLASTYAEAFARTGGPFYAEVVRETLDYVLREMTGPDGAFLSAQDAEVDHREGGNYIWTPDEVREVLTRAGRAEDVDFTVRAYGLDRGTNFTDPHHPRDPRNVLYLPERPDALAESLELTLDAFNEHLRAVNAVLLDARAQRPQPSTDDKVLTSWNGLMIAGFADGGRVLDETRFVDAGRRALDRIVSTMRTDDGRLRRTSRADRVRIDGFLEDYAGLIHGILALHRATEDDRLLTLARDLARVAREEFADPNGGWFDTRADQADLFVRVRSTYDGATPSGNGLMLLNVVELFVRTGDEAYLDEAVAALAARSAILARAPVMSVTSARALHRLLEHQPDAVRAVGRDDDAPAARSPLGVTAEPTRVHVTSAQPTTFDIVLRLEPGYHVNAHDPGHDGLVPLEIVLVGATGLAFEVDYPPGAEFDGPIGGMRVHAGVVRVPATLRRDGAVEGTPKVMLTSQVCDDRSCRPAETVEVPVEIIID